MPKPKPQQHKILRQVIEIDGCTHDKEKHVRSLMRSTYYKHLLASIDRTCSKLSSFDRIHRIDRLEIDLGKLPINALGTDGVQSFETAFKKKLAAAIRHTPEVDANLELFDFFIHSGSLPWWADKDNPDLLPESLETLIKKKPHALRRILRSPSNPERLWRRVAGTYPDALLNQLANLLAPDIWGGDGPARPAVGTSWLVLLQEASATQKRSKIVTRNQFWEQALRAAGSHGTAPASSASHVYKSILQHIAKSIGANYPALINTLQQLLKNKSVTTSVNPWVRKIIDQLAQDLATQPDKSAESGAGVEIDATLADLTKLLTRLEQSSNPDARLRDQLRALLERLPATLSAQALAQLDELKDATDQSQQDKLIKQVRSILDPLSEADTYPQTEPVRSEFSKADALYIGNAGLVVLWPFLTHFFQRLNLIEEDIETKQKRFTDEAAAQRAVGLLQYLASADESPRETLLPLNKLLCGMAVDTIFDFGPEINDKEKEECDQLLTAVIQRAPILKKMSHNGFRNSFLLRQGQLSICDERWLLRVERETFDIVLNRIPWGFSIIKLPWMSAPIQTQW